MGRRRLFSIEPATNSSRSLSNVSQVTIFFTLDSMDQALFALDMMAQGRTRLSRESKRAMFLCSSLPHTSPRPFPKISGICHGLARSTHRAAFLLDAPFHMNDTIPYPTISFSCRRNVFSHNPYHVSNRCHEFLLTM